MHGEGPRDLPEYVLKPAFAVAEMVRLRNFILRNKMKPFRTNNILNLLSKNCNFCIILILNILSVDIYFRWIFERKNFFARYRRRKGRTICALYTFGAHCSCGYPSLPPPCSTASPVRSASSACSHALPAGRQASSSPKKNHPYKSWKKISSKLGAKDIKKAEFCPDFKNVQTQEVSKDFFSEKHSFAKFC